MKNIVLKTPPTLKLYTYQLLILLLIWESWQSLSLSLLCFALLLLLLLLLLCSAWHYLVVSYPAVSYPVLLTTWSWNLERTSGTPQWSFLVASPGTPQECDTCQHGMSKYPWLCRKLHSIWQNGKSVDVKATRLPTKSPISFQLLFNWNSIGFQFVFNFWKQLN